MRTFTKEQFWEEALRHSPTLQRWDFDRRWKAMWLLAHAMSVVIDMRTTSQN